jgi:hypothetical protein
MAKSQNVQFLDELRLKTGLRIVPRFAFLSELQGTLDWLYPPPLFLV